MKHYNKSEIMKRAWELNRTEDMPISEAMKKAWHEQRTFKEKIVLYLKSLWKQVKIAIF